MRGQAGGARCCRWVGRPPSVPPVSLGLSQCGEARRGWGVRMVRWGERCLQLPLESFKSTPLCMYIYIYIYASVCINIHTHIYFTHKIIEMPKDADTRGGAHACNQTHVTTTSTCGQGDVNSLFLRVCEHGLLALPSVCLSVRARTRGPRAVPACVPQGSAVGLSLKLQQLFFK